MLKTYFTECLYLVLISRVPSTSIFLSNISESNSLNDRKSKKQVYYKNFDSCGKGYMDNVPTHKRLV